MYAYLTIPLHDLTARVSHVGSPSIDREKREQEWGYNNKCKGGEKIESQKLSKILSFVFLNKSMVEQKVWGGDDICPKFYM